jgi:Arc/MetJ family transcription regulator
MDILRRKFQGQQPASIMAQLRNETAEGVAGEKNLGLIFRTVFPEEPMEDVVRRIGIASKGQDMKALLGGSGTAPTASAAKRAGSSFNAEEFIGAATGSTMDLGRLLRRFINRDGVDLTDAQNQEVVRVLLSENPDFVRRAMTDQTGWGALDRAVAQTLERLAIGGTRAATVGGAGVSVGLLGPQ